MARISFITTLACGAFGSATPLGANPTTQLEVTVEVDPPAYDGLQTLIDEEARISMSAGDYPRAIRLFKRLLEIDPHDVRALREVGRLANAVGDLELAVEALGKVDDLDGTAVDPEIDYLRAESLWALGKRGEARREFDRAERELGPGPHDWQHTLWLARIATLRGDVDAAVAFYDPLLEVAATDQEYAEVYLFKVEAHTLNQRWPEAERLLREFLVKFPDHERARGLLAWVLEGGGKLDEELALRAEVAAAKGDDPTKKLEYARALERANEYSAALSHYREAKALGVTAAARDIDRLERRMSPELGGGLTMRADPSGDITGWRGGATVPFTSRLRVAVTATGEESTGGLGMYERSATTGAAWMILTAPRGRLLGLGTTVRLDDIERGVGGSAIVHSRPHRDAQLQLRGDYNLPWHESASTLRDRGSMDTLSAQLYMEPPLRPDRVVVSFSALARRLALAPQVGVPMAHALQVFGAAGVDVTLSSRPEQVMRGESFDRELLTPRSLTTATVVSYRHYEMTSDDPFGSRLVLVERSSIDELSGVVRRVSGRGLFGAELRGGLGYDWARYVKQWRAGASLLVAATSWSRLTADYDVASESGTGLTGRQHIGLVAFHVDL